MSLTSRTHPPTTDWPPAPQETKKRSKITWLVAIGVVIALALCVVWILLPTSPRPAAQAPTTPTELAAASSTTATIPTTQGQAAPAQTASGCPAVEPDPNPKFDRIPEDTTWSLTGSMATPSSATAGPTRVDGIRGCYARSPQGAAFAAANFITGLIAASPEQRPALIADRVSRTRSYEALMSQASAEISAAPTAELPGEQDNGGGRQLTGVRWIDYTDDRAVISIAYKITGGGFNAATYTMGWEDGDWKLVFPGGGAIPMQPLDNAAGYVELDGIG